MPYATTPDNVRLYYEEAGTGTPILFLHEFASDHRGWEPQMRAFARRYRCIAYSARGYAPSDVPADKNAYSYQHVMRDAVAVLDHLKIDQAHLIGLSMGGYTSVQVALNHPGRVRSMVLAGTGSGSERWYTQDFHNSSRALAAEFERDGSAAVAEGYGQGPSRLPFLIKDPRGFAEFASRLAEHDAQGSANTSRGFQGGRPSLYARRLRLGHAAEERACGEPGGARSVQCRGGRFPCPRRSRTLGPARSAHARCAAVHTGLEMTPGVMARAARDAYVRKAR